MFTAPFKLPSFIQINLTNNCNSNCKHCYNDSGVKFKNELTNKEIYNLLDYFLDKKIVCITFGGGEPLLHHSIFKFIDYANKRGGKITILSNGLLINEQNAKKLSECGISRVRISLDGSNEKINDFIRSDGSFNGAVQALKNLKKTNIQNIAVMTSINKYNINDIENIIKLLIDLNINDIKFIPTIFEGRAKIYLKKFSLDKNYVQFLIKLKNKLSKKYSNRIYISIDSPLEALYYQNNKKRLAQCGPCLIGQVFLGILANGNIFACPMLDKIILGNIRDKNFNLEKLWNDSTILQKARNLDLLKGKCKSCKIKKYCGGGCRAMSYLKHNDMLKPDPFCWKNN